MSRYPTSKSCPACGGSNYRSVNPDAWVAFAQDRVCNACGVRYTPPTPAWAAVAFIVIGLILFLLPMSSLVITLARMAAEPRSGAGGIAVGGPFELMLGILGLVAMVHGVRALMGKTNSGPAPAPPPLPPPPPGNPPPQSTPQG
jgi:hypothetical protein